MAGIQQKQKLGIAWLEFNGQYCNVGIQKKLFYVDADAQSRKQWAE
jgi:hypothetical protein